MHEFTPEELPDLNALLMKGSYEITLPDKDARQCFVIWLSYYGQHIGNVKLRTSAFDGDVEYDTFEVLASTPWDIACTKASPVVTTDVYHSPAPDGSEDTLDLVTDAAIDVDKRAAAALKSGDLIPWWLKLAVGTGIVFGAYKVVKTVID